MPRVSRVRFARPVENDKTVSHRPALDNRDGRKHTGQPPMELIMKAITAKCPHCQQISALSYYRMFITRGWYCLACVWRAQPQPGWWRR
jgi:hypothetical protein